MKNEDQIKMRMTSKDIRYDISYMIHYYMIRRTSKVRTTLKRKTTSDKDMEDNLKRKTTY